MITKVGKRDSMQLDDDNDEIILIIYKVVTDVQKVNETESYSHFKFQFLTFFKEVMNDEFLHKIWV